MGGAGLCRRNVLQQCTHNTHLVTQGCTVQSNREHCGRGVGDRCDRGLCMFEYLALSGEHSEDYDGGGIDVRLYSTVIGLYCCSEN